jgi:hypothetical protein
MEVKAKISDRRAWLWHVLPIVSFQISFLTGCSGQETRQEADATSSPIPAKNDIRNGE